MAQNSHSYSKEGKKQSNRERTNHNKTEIQQKKQQTPYPSSGALDQIIWTPVGLGNLVLPVLLSAATVVLG